MLEHVINEMLSALTYDNGSLINSLNDLNSELETQNVTVDSLQLAVIGFN